MIETRLMVTSRLALAMLRAAGEGVAHHGQKGEEKQRHGKRTESQEQADLLAEEIGQDEPR